MNTEKKNLIGLYLIIFNMVVAAELLEKPEEINDFVCFLASDSESDNDDDVDINVTATASKSNSKQTPNFTKDALFSAIGLTDTG